MTMESQAKRTLLMAVFWLVFLALIFGGFLIWRHGHRKTLNDETGSADKYKHEIVVRVDSFSGYCILRSPEMRKALKPESIKLTFVDDKADYVDRLKAVRDGKADLAVFTVDSLLKAGAVTGEFPATIVLAIDETWGADAAVAWPAVATINDLNKPNAKIVATPDSPSEFLARIMLADFNLQNLPQEKWLDPADGAGAVYEQFKKAPRTEPRAYVLWQPYVAKALQEPGAHVLLGSDKLKGYILDVLVARRQFLKENEGLVESVVRAYLQAAYSYTQSNGMVDLVMDDAKTSGAALTRPEAEELVKGIRWKNCLENYAHFRLLSAGDAGGLDDLEEVIDKVKRILLVTKAVKPEQLSDKATGLFYDKIMARLQSSNFHPDQKVGLVSAGGKMEGVRGVAELPALSDDDWKRLVPVGDMRIDILSFRRGTTELAIESQRDLEDLAARLTSMPYYYLTVVGHSRAEGDVEANRRLAADRAKTVADILAQHKIGANRVRVLAAEPSSDGGEAQSVTFQLGQRPY